jgi:hypothetical protein
MDVLTRVDTAFYKVALRHFWQKSCVYDDSRSLPSSPEECFLARVLFGGVDEIRSVYSQSVSLQYGNIPMVKCMLHSTTSRRWIIVLFW